MDWSSPPMSVRRAGTPRKSTPMTFSTHLPRTNRPRVKAALEMVTELASQRRHRTLGADRGYDTTAFVAGARAAGVTPHVAPNVHARRRQSAIDGRTTRHPGFTVSQRKRKLVEEGFGWGKTVGLLRKLRHRGREKVAWIFTFTTAAYNLVRLRTLIRVGACA